jgi:hypothetical protein
VLLLDTHGLKKNQIDAENFQHNQGNRVIKAKAFLHPLNRNNVRYLI